MSDGLVTGIGVTHNMDGIVITKLHKGNRKPKTGYELELQSDEHIEFMQIHYDEEGVHEILVKSNLGHMLVMDESHADHKAQNFETKEINLADGHEALVGFKTQFEDYLTNLAIYTATRVGFPSSNSLGEKVRAG